MTLQELRYLAALAKTHHFGRAAALCGVSQPNLSMAIRKLEDRLGYPLFERLPKGVLPTAQGLTLIPQAEKIMASLDLLEELASAQKDPLQTRLVMGGSRCLGPYLFPKLLPLLGIFAGQTQIDFLEERELALGQMLQAGEIDVVISSQTFGNSDLLSLPLFNEPLMAVFPRAHALSAVVSIAPPHFATQTFIRISASASLQALQQDWVDKYCPAKVLAASSLEMAREMIGLGLGVSILPALAAYSVEGPNVMMRSLELPRHRSVFLVWRASYPRPQVIELLRQILARCQWPFTTQMDAGSSSGHLVDNQWW